MCTSVPQMVVMLIFTTASPGPARGTGLRPSTMRPGPVKTAAFMVGIWSSSFLGWRRPGASAA
jgi:hypothetical protein